MPRKPVFDSPAIREAPVVAAVGDLVQDITVLMSGSLVANGQVTGRISRQRGGSAANIVSGLAARGFRARFYGRVGSDDLGLALCQTLTAEGVDVRARKAGSTCTVVCLVDPSGERSFVADTSADDAGREGSDLPLDDLPAIDVLHLSGYWLLGGVDPDFCTSLRELRETHPFSLTMDLGNASRVRAYGTAYVHQLVRDLEPDVLFANADEAREAQLGAVPTLTRLLVVTAGRDPTTLVHDGVTQQVPVRASDTIVDTTGAGDAFVAGFLAAALRGATPHEAAVEGHDGARHVVARPGAV